MSRFRQLWIGLIAIPLCILIAVAVTAAFGPLFGAWDWRATSFVLLVCTTIGFLTLDTSSHTEDSPSRRISPGMTDAALSGDWDSIQYTRTTDEGAESLAHKPKPPAATTGWTRQALITSLAAFAFLIIMLV